MNLADLMERFSTVDAARAYLEKQRWPNGPECPHCGLCGEASPVDIRVANPAGQSPGYGLAGGLDALPVRNGNRFSRCVAIPGQSVAFREEDKAGLFEPGALNGAASQEVVSRIMGDLRKGWPQAGIAAEVAIPHG